MSDPTLVVRVGANLAEFKANLQEGLNQIETTAGALTRMSSAYDGSKIIQQAGATSAAIQNIGGVTKLTSDEQARALPILDQAIAKYAALGKDAPKGMTDLAASLREAQEGAKGATGWFHSLGESWAAHIAEGVLLRDVIREVITFAKEAVTETARIEDLAKATGMTAEEVQKFTYVGKDFGVTGEEMARGVEQLSAKLANGDKSATSAVQMLGLSVKALIAEGPAAAFLDVADATGKVEDPMTRSGLAAQEFGGKLAKILLPALGELRVKMKDVPQEAIISPENVKAVHDFDVGVEHLIGNLKALVVTGLSDASGFVRQFIPRYGGGTGTAFGQQEQTATPAPIIGPVSSHEQTQEVLTNAQLIQNALTALRTEALMPLTVAQQANIDEFHKWGMAATDIAKLVTNGNVVAVEKYLQGEKDLAKQLAETDAVLMISYEKRVAGLKAVTEANLKAYDFGGQIASLYQLIASEETLAKAVYGQLTSEKDRAKVIEELGLRRVEITNQIMALEVKHAGLVNAQVIAELEARAALAKAQGRNVDGTVGEMSAYDKMLYALDQLHQKKQAGIDQYNQEQVIVKQYTDAMYAAAVADDAVTAAANKHTQAERDRVAAIQAVADAAYKARQDLANYAAAAVPTSDSLTKAGIVASTQSVSGFMQSVATRDVGGPVSAGQPYYIGTGAQPELFVPQTSGTMYPAGTGPSGGTTIVINVTQPLGTPSAIAAAVDQALMTRQRNTGQRMPVGN